MKPSIASQWRIIKDMVYRPRCVLASFSLRRADRLFGTLAPNSSCILRLPGMFKGNDFGLASKVDLLILTDELGEKLPD
jgi:hypothetical protein